MCYLALSELYFAGYVIRLPLAWRNVRHPTWSDWSQSCFWLPCCEMTSLFCSRHPVYNWSKFKMLSFYAVAQLIVSLLLLRRKNGGRWCHWSVILRHNASHKMALRAFLFLWPPFRPTFPLQNNFLNNCDDCEASAPPLFCILPLFFSK